MLSLTLTRTRVAALFSLTLMLGTTALPALAEAPGGMAYINHSYGGGYKGTLEHDLMIESAPGSGGYFWSHQFQLAGADGGYSGLQLNGNINGVPTARLAIFSIWNATESRSDTVGAVCHRFGGEGIGQSCAVPFNWRAGRTYRFTVAHWGNGWYSASVKDLSSGATTIIGAIHEPHAVFGFGEWSSAWVEIFSDMPCSSIPQTRAYFTNVKAGGARPTRIDYALGQRCGGHSLASQTNGGPAVATCSVQRALGAGASANGWGAGLLGLVVVAKLARSRRRGRARK